MKHSLSSKSRTSSRLLLGSALLLGLTVNASIARADDVTRSNTTTIAINDDAPGSPYPSTIAVSGVTGTIIKATVTLNNFTHFFPADVGVLLVSPSGRTVQLMVDTCGGGYADHANLTFDDDAATALPSEETYLEGDVKYRPAQYETDGKATDFPSPAPSGPWGTALSELNGDDPNGQWRLFVLDDAIDDSGEITGGWSLRLVTPSVNPPTTAITTPTPNQKMAVSAFEAGSISGTASDNVSVSSVKVRLSRKRNNVNQFWNGTDWVANSLTFVDADITNNFVPLGVGNTNVTWSLDTNALPQNKLDAGQYGVRVYSVDNVGNKSANVDQIFTLYSDNTAPTVSITSPTSSQVVDINSVSGATFSGTASDNVGVASVKLKLGRRRNNVWQYWNGSDFTPTSATFDAALTTAGAPSVTWQLASAIPADKLDRGGYSLYATAYDAAGNKVTSASRLFAINGKVNSPSSAAADAASASSAGDS